MRREQLAYNEADDARVPAPQCANRAVRSVGEPRARRKQWHRC